MIEYAQTNIQLYNQLAAAGWNDDDGAVIRRAHDLAMCLTAGYVRPNHKPFIAHLVGTASIVAAHVSFDHVPDPKSEARPIRNVDLVSAALLHSVYLIGNFGDGRRKHNESRRRIVREQIGTGAEQIVQLFSTISWRMGHFMEMCRGYALLSCTQRAAVAVKLADIHEEYLDQGACYAPGKDLSSSQIRHDLCETTAAAGGRLWAQALQAALAAADARNLAAGMATSRQQSFIPSPPMQSGILHRVRLRFRAA